MSSENQTTCFDKSQPTQKQKKPIRIRNLRQGCV